MKSEIVSQYNAALKMLFSTIELCPDKLWIDEEYENSFWRIVYHTLFYTSLYLSKNPQSFTTWSKHKENYNCLGNFTYDNKPIVINEIYSKEILTEYLKAILEKVEISISEMEENKISEFNWIPGNELNRHLYNIRHIQHHTGQLVERLHCNKVKGIKWIG